MARTLSEVTRDAAGLAAADQVKLARIMLDLAEPGVEPPAEVDSAWETEIQRRLAEVRSGDVAGVDLTTLKRRIGRRMGR